MDYVLWYLLVGAAVFGMMLILVKQERQYIYECTMLEVVLLTLAGMVLWPTILWHYFKRP